MEKLKSRFVCQNCGQMSIRWLGKCPSCEQWDTLTEEVIAVKGQKRKESLQLNAVYKLSEVVVDKTPRLSIGIGEFDRLLGGGIVPGSVTLLGGEPGIGKSTLLLQVACQIAERGASVFYISGEESIVQIKLRAQRLNYDNANLHLLNVTNLDEIIMHLNTLKPEVVIIDSIQVLFMENISSAPGSVSQVRECVSSLVTIAKREGFSMFLIGHVTKTGAIAGPRVVEHLVDTVLYFEGDNRYKYRILRAVKNRFGSTDEIGIFLMQQDGLKEVKNPSEMFIDSKRDKLSGSTIVVATEGTRSILVEMQALVAPTMFGMPERRSIGFDHRRLAILLAVLEKRVGLRLQNQDVFVNVVGGLQLREPAVDLGIVIAIVSSFREIAISCNTVCIGEVGLGGELRAVNQIDKRITEAQRLGFKKIILPKANKLRSVSEQNVEIVPVADVNEAVDYLFN